MYIGFMQDETTGEWNWAATFAFAIDAGDWLRANQRGKWPICIICLEPFKWRLIRNTRLVAF